ncbi:MAG: patatin-like phospholipase family protein [Clostridia bacterium]|nr:patatin-like phospholipase family protein [Clostridia bacterium]
MKKLGLALGAGGGRGIVHIGFIKALEEENIKIDIIAGSSMGSIVGACYAMGMSADEMWQEIKNLKKNEVVDFSINPIFSGAFMRSKKIFKKLSTYFGEKTFNDLKLPFYAVSVDLKSGKPYVSQGDDHLTTLVVASSSIPGVFKPVEYKDMLLCDGAVKYRVPCSVAKEMGADVVVGIDALGPLKPIKKKRLNLISTVFRMFEVVDCDLTERCYDIDKPNLFIVPDLGDTDQFDFKSFDYIYEQGYKCGKEYAPQIKELLK